MYKKILAGLVSVAIMLPVIPVFADYESTNEPLDNGYFHFYEDFTEWTDEDACSKEGGKFVAEKGKAVIGKVYTDGVKPEDYKEDGGFNTAMRDDGVNWKTSTVWTGAISEPNIRGQSYINAEKHALALTGMAYVYSMVNLDLSCFGDEEDIPKAVQKFHFTTEQSSSHFQGMALFVSDTEKRGILFGTNSDGAVIFFMSGGNTMDQVNDTEKITAGGTGKMTWDITVTDDGKISYSAKNANGKTWKNEISVDKNYLEKFDHLAAFFSRYDSSTGGYLTEFEYETGNYYTGGMGEYREVIYRELMQNAKQTENEEYDEYELPQKSIIRKAESLKKKTENTPFWLSEDGEEWDEFSVDNNRLWLNSYNEKEYKYVRTPVGNGSKFCVYKDIWKDDTIELRKGESESIWYSLNGEIQSKVDWFAERDDITTISKYGEIKAVKEGRTNIGISGKDLMVGLLIKGPLSDANECTDPELKAELIQSYVKTQQEIIDKLNDAIANENISEISAWLGGTSDVSLKNIDLIDFKEHEMPSYELSDMALRIATYKDGFKVESLEDIEKFGEFLKKERAVGKLINLATGKEVLSAIEDNNGALGIDLSNEYFKTFDVDISDALKKTEFKNYSDFENKLNEAIVLENTKNSKNGKYLIGMLEKYADVIEYDSKNFDKYKDSQSFRNTYIDKAKELDEISDIKDFIDNYTEKSSDGGSSGGGGGSSSGSRSGGGSSGGGISIIAAPTTPVKQDDNTVVEKVQLFTDVPTDFWGYDAIRYMKGKGAASGYSDGSFMPDKDITRAEFVQLLLTVFNSKVDIPEDFVNPFDDVSENDWFYKITMQANIIGVLGGNGKGCEPNKPINRQEMLSLIYRMAEKQGKALSRSTEFIKFNDEADIAEWARPSVLKMQAAGIVNGIDGKFMPYSNSTRAMAAQMLYKTMNSFEEVSASE